MGRKEFFRIPHQCISRDDIKAIGFKGEDLTDHEMQSIANRMGDFLIDDVWWNVLREVVKQHEEWREFG